MFRSLPIVPASQIKYQRRTPTIPLKRAAKPKHPKSKISDNKKAAPVMNRGGLFIE
jgi:hypothetical protein